MVRKIINSMYTRFIAFFLGAFIISILASVIYITLTQAKDIKNSINDTMYNRAEKIKLLVEDFNISIEEACDYLKTDEMNISISDTTDSVFNIFSSDEIVKLDSGEIVSILRPSTNSFGLAAVKINNQYVLITPDIHKSPIKQFRIIQRNTFIVPLIIGNILIIFAVAMVVKPIRKISAASEEVAKGNFNVKLKVKGENEISDLSNNFNLMVKQLSLNEYLHRDFVSNVSHEFKTPITSLIGYAKLLRKDSLTEKEKQNYIDIIVSESERLSKLSSNLLMLSKLENGVIRNKNDKFSLTEQIRDAILLMQNHWEKKNLELDLELDEINFIGNKDLMYQVWINLISNAIKYSKNDGILEIRLKKTDRIIVEIIDNGIGMTKEEQDKVFLRFYKADQSRNTSGTGLGLPIAKKIIELHSGTISVESTLGRGSRFKVILGE